MLDWLKRSDMRIRQNALHFKEFDKSKPLDQYSFVVFDTELTSLSKRKGEIISIGAVRIENLQIDMGSFYSEHVRPRKLKHTEATLIHRITPQELHEAPDLEDVLPRFIEYLGNSLIVGHCIYIDMTFLNSACRRLLGGRLSTPTFDTMRLARGYQRMLHGQYHDHTATRASYNLHELSKRFALPVFEPHDALEDALQTAYLFLFLVKKLSSGGVETLNDLHLASRSGSWEPYTMIT